MPFIDLIDKHPVAAVVALGIAFLGTIFIIVAIKDE